MSNPTLKAFGLMLLACSASAQTGPGGQAAMSPVNPAMCDAFASMPNSPMTVEACRSMLQVVKDDPSAHRKGDAAMTCAEIHAELKAATASMGVSDAEAARRKKSLEDTQTLNERHGSRAAAATAPNAIALQSLAVLGAVTPSAVTAPLVAAQQADLQAKGKVAADAYLLESRQLTNDNASVAASTMRDPRTARLSQLAVQKACQATTR